MKAREARATLTAQFLRDQAEAAATQWEQRLVKPRGARAAGQPAERAEVDAHISRQRYERISTKVVIDAQRDGLELVEPGSFPGGIRLPIGVGALAGIPAGVLLVWLATALSSWRTATIAA